MEKEIFIEDSLPKDTFLSRGEPVASTKIVWHYSAHGASCVASLGCEFVLGFYVCTGGGVVCCFILE